MILRGWKNYRVATSTCAKNSRNVNFIIQASAKKELGSHKNTVNFVTQTQKRVFRKETSALNSLPDYLYFIVALKSIYIILRFGNLSHGQENRKLSCFWMIKYLSAGCFDLTIFSNRCSIQNCFLMWVQFYKNVRSTKLFL